VCLFSRRPCHMQSLSWCLTFCCYVSYTDPVDGATTSEQGLILSFEYGNGDAARCVFRLSGTGSAGATIRMYLEKYEKDEENHGEAAPVALKSLAERAIGLVQLKELTGRDAPTVIT
jgi:phosphoglucomutase